MYAALDEIEDNFNSHTREGVTDLRITTSRSPSYFNSHTREGVTEYRSAVEKNEKISTHTPVRV